MATTSLGRLTLDLAVRLSEFSEGLSRAERETQERTRQMGESVSNFRQRLVDELGGTQIGGVIDSLNERFGSLRGGGLAVGGALAGMAVGGVAVAAGALTALALETAKADVELQVMANTANTSLKGFQVLTYAAAQLGVEQDALAGILADTQEKLGEFSATGGGGAADFFEALQNNTKMTDEEIRELGKTLQGKDGVGAIQYLKDELDGLGATSQEQRFIMESLAGDLGNLMPLFADGGQILNEYGKELEDAGVIKTKESIEQSRRLTAQTQAIQTRFDGFKTQLAVQMMPVLNNLIGHFVNGDSKGSKFGSTMESVGLIAKSVGAGIISVATGVKLLVRMIQAFGEQVANIGVTTDNFLNAEGFMAKARALKTGAGAVYDINARLGVETVGILADARDAITGMFEPATDELTGLAGALYKTNGELDRSTTGLRTNTVEAEANAKALEKQAAAAEKAGIQQARLVGISGDTGIGSAHLHIQYRDKSRAVSASDLARFQAGGKAITDYPMTSGFGKRNTGIKGASTNHKGTDFGIPKNTPITTNVPVAGVKTWHDSKGGGYVSTVTFEDGVVIDLLHQMPGVMGVEKGASTGNKSIDGALKKADALAQKAAAEALKAQEEIERRQLSIAAKWANEKEKIELNYQNNVAEIKETYAEGSADYIKYMARAEEDYTRAKNSGMLALSEKYVSEEQRIHADHKKAMKVIEEAYIEDDKLRQYFIDRQNAMYQEDLDNFKFATQAKARAQNKLYQSIADSARAGGINALSTGKDSMMQRTLSGEDYQQWRLNQDYVEGFDSINNQYKSRESEVNERDERTKDYLLPELERNELLELARQEHLDKMWALEQEYALRDKTLAEQQAAQRVAIYQSLFAGMTEAAAVFFGESSRMHKLAFAAEKAYAVHKALMNVEETYSNTFNSLSAIPLFGPYIAAPGAAAAAAIQVASAAGIQGMSAPTVAGIAHGGLDYVPKESTYLLDEGERVLSPKQNKDFTRFMDTAGRQGNITINNNSSAEVSARREPNGAVTIDMVDKMIEKSFRRIGRPNSLESKSIQRHTTARVKR